MQDENRQNLWHKRAALALLACLCSACPSGDKEDTGPCEPGYGTLHLSSELADTYTESVREELDDRMVLSVDHVVQEIETCRDYTHFANEGVLATRTGLDVSMDAQVPTGQTCAFMTGFGTPEDGFGEIGCGGKLDLTIIPECERVEAAIVVTCTFSVPDTDA